MSEQKETIANRWLQGILDTYPAQTAKFLREQKDRFSNPVGQNLASAIRSVVDELVQSARPEALRAALDPIIRIRAVQEFSASEALSFVFLLKPLVREMLQARAKEDELLAFDRHVDDLALLAFDVYTQCREQLCEIRVGEMRRRTAKLVERMNKIYGPPPDEEPPLESGAGGAGGEEPPKEQE